jgi:hypothetical protein
MILWEVECSREVVEGLHVSNGIRLNCDRCGEVMRWIIAGLEALVGTMIDYAVCRVVVNFIHHKVAMYCLTR